MQKACEIEESTMAAIVGLSDEVVRKVCDDIPESVIAANFNCPGQVVISGSQLGVEIAIEKLKAEGAKRALPLAVGGAFHSRFMKPAEDELHDIIQSTLFSAPSCPIYQNVDGKPHTDPGEIQENLITQLTSPVLWTQTMEKMISDGVDEFIECDRRFPTQHIT
jgi:[acyl-carrier-protein] S-malonyltransferase